MDYEYGRSNHKTPREMHEIGYELRDNDSAYDDLDDDEVLPDEDSKPFLLKQKKLSSDPDGNLYRGWAVKIPQGNRQLIFTFLVMFVQVLGPLMMCQWAWHDLATRGMPQVPQSFSSLFDSWGREGVTFKDIQLKALCFALLLII